MCVRECVRREKRQRELNRGFAEADGPEFRISPQKINIEINTLVGELKCGTRETSHTQINIMIEGFWVP